MIEMRPVVGRWTIRCPWCAAAQLHIRATDLTVVGGACWLDDGDGIGGLERALTDVQRHPTAYDHEMLVGTCRACGERFFVAEASFMAGDRETTAEYLYRNQREECTRYFQCTHHDAPALGQWLGTIGETPFGPVHRHTFGPFRLTDADGVIGPTGVSSCGASSHDAWDTSAAILLTAWDAMRRPLLP